MKTFAFFIALIFAANHVFPQGTAINSTGAAADSSALLDLSSNNKGILIPRMSKTEKLAISSPATGLMIYQTDDTTGFWYFSGAKWVTVAASGGTSGAGAHYVGELYGGGVVFYVDESRSHGLICSMLDLNSTQVWVLPASLQTTAVTGTSANYCPGVNGGDICAGCGSRSYWDGLTNSKAIVSQTNHSASAACLCRSYTNANYGTGIYSDWYLPAYSELTKLYIALFEVNRALDSDGNGSTSAISFGNYWSSTEYSSNLSMLFDFYSVNSYQIAKSTQMYVRAVRAF